MEERTSLIVILMVANAKDWAALTLVNQLPDEISLVTYFTNLYPAPESAELIESLEDTDQGRLINYTVRANLFRESPMPDSIRNKHVLIYIETLNGEQYLLGSGDNPMEVTYNRPSGMTISDSNETTLQIKGSFPLSV